MDFQKLLEVLKALHDEGVEYVLVLESETKVYEGVPVWVATPKALYDMKKQAVRLQDRADAQILKEEFDLGED